MKMMCCEATCTKPAEFQIFGSNRRPDNHTEACQEHVGTLLGTPIGQPQDEAWTVVELVPARGRAGLRPRVR